MERRCLISHLVPEGAVAVELLGSWPEIDEDGYGTKGFSPKRRHEFLTGRRCASQALEKLGVGTQRIPRGVNGEPIWPLNVVGSITHCAGYCAAVVAFCEDVRSIGIDAEPNEPLPQDVLGLVATKAELDLVNSTGAEHGHLDKLLFSAKESVYKAWYPLVNRWLEFQEVEICFDFVRETFDAEIRCARLPHETNMCVKMRGNYTVTDGLILVASYA